MNATAQAPKVSDMKIGTVIIDRYGEHKVTGVTTYDGETWWDLQSAHGATTVGQYGLRFYTLKP